ncbi:MAG: hypothetical protein IKO36_04865 [Bacteroidaceae bacterium]|nr:hypothetical protein [Bacteroidaceae bacterium]
MTREEQRCKAAKEYAEQWYKELGTSVEEFPTDAQITIDKFIKGAEWADNHPNWHKADEELPPIDTTITYKFSKKVLVSDGEHIHVSRYDYNTGEWLVIDITVTYWMYLPEFPKED